MKFPSPLLAGTLRRRYKRFLADIVLEDGTEITAHCANPGAMTGLAGADMPVRVSEHRGKGRRLAYSWELAEADGTLVAVNTHNPNRIVAEALENDLIAELTGYACRRREVKYADNSRIDFLLDQGGSRPACYVEVKNVHLVRVPGLAEFPDSVTARGVKHLDALVQMVRQGFRAVMLYVVQRGDCSHFAPARDLDPAYAQAFARAAASGVENICYDCNVTLTEVVLRGKLEIVPE